MKRSVSAMMTAAAVAGCQGPATRTADQVAVVPGTGGQPVAVAKPTATGEIVPAGYNTGNGLMSSYKFGNQKIAAALPSHGGMAPGMGMGGPGMGGPGMGMGGPGMGGMMPPGMGGPGAGPTGPGGYAGMPLGPRFTTSRTQIRFAAPLSMKVFWQMSDDGMNVRFGDTPLVAPDRYNFAQGQIYRLKLADIPKREGAELYPTLEVYPGSAKTDAYLAHNAVPLEFTDEDFDQVAGGNMVTKVLYLPDAKYQELAIAGVETLVSTRLEPGVDPVKEAHRRGSILAVVRMGSVDLEPAHSPPLLPTGPAYGMPMPGMMPPPGMMNPGMRAPAKNIMPKGATAPAKMTSGVNGMAPVPKLQMLPAPDAPAMPVAAPSELLIGVPSLK